MHKRAVALVLSLAIINVNSYGVISYASDYVGENIVKNEETIELQNNIEPEDEKQYKTQPEVNSYSVYSTEELKNAISTAVEGDTIKVYPGNYIEDTIVISNPGISLQGYTSSGQPVSDKLDAVAIKANVKVNSSNITINGLETSKVNIGDGATANSVTIKNTYILGSLYIGYDRYGSADNTLIEDSVISGFGYIGGRDSSATNTTLRGTKMDHLYAGISTDYGADSTTIDNCEMSGLTRITGSNNVIKNSNMQSLYIKSTDTVIENSTSSTLYIADTDNASNITVRDSRVSNNIFIGRKGGTATDILLDNVSINYGVGIGYDGGNASNVTIRNSNIKSSINIGSFTRGRAKNTKIYDSIIGAVYIGTSTGISENTNIMRTNITGAIKIGDSESKSENTFIQTDNKNIDDSGRNTTIINTLLSNSPKIKGRASQGQRVEIIKDGNILINKIVQSDNLIDWYIDENDTKFTLNTGDQLQIKVYDSSNVLLFDESIVVQKNTTPPSTPSINRLDNTSTKITGKAERNTTIVAKIGDTEIGRVKPDVDGNFEISLDAPLKEYTIVEMYAIDKDGNVSDTVHREVNDVIRPDEPQVNQVTTKSNTITGTAEPHSRVIVKLNANTAMQSYEGYADKDGNFQVSLGKLVRKNDTIDVYAMDSSYNQSDKVSVNIIEVLPQAPIVNETLTNASKMINGKSDPNCDIQAYIDGKFAMAATSDEQGNFTLNIPWVDAYNIRIPAGTKIDIVAIDEDRDKSKATTITAEDVRPNAITKIDEINNTSNTITGKAESGKEVIAFIVEEEIGRATTDSEGNFMISLPNALEQDTEVRFIVAGENNILSEIKSTTVKDKIAPVIEYVSEVNNREQMVNGKAEPGSTIFVLRENQNENDEGVRTTTTDEFGYFSMHITNLKEDEVVRIYAKDKSNNRSEIVEKTVLDRVAPLVSVGMIQNTDTTISGNTEPNCSVVAYLRVPDVIVGYQIGRTTSNENGDFTIELSEKLKYQDKVLIEVMDTSGNVSSIEMTVEDMTPPYIMEMTPINNTTKKIKGKVSEAGAKIKLQYLDQEGNLISELGEGEADINGKYEIHISTKLAVSNKVRVISYDVLGNYTTAETTVGYVKEFKDVESHWAREQIYSFIEDGFISGYPNDTFKPDNQITRAEFVKIVNGVFEYTEKGEVKFSDVSKNEWYYDEVAKAVKAGYINGKSETSFDPMAPITRQEAAKIIATIKNCTDDNYDKIDSFNDSNTVASWAKSYVEGVLEAGYMNGYSDNTFKPEQRITRAEAVVTLQRTIN